MNVLDTFAGAGGFSLGFHMAGCNIIGAIEIDQWASDTFSYNHPNAKVLQNDITSITDDELRESFSGCHPDIVLGGPPCQGFSICTLSAGDPKDPRNSLFREFIKIGKVFSPSLMVMENVPNIIKARTLDNQFVIDIIESELKSLDYHVYSKILECTDYGIPQIRRRLFVIASKTKLERPFPLPTHIVRENTQLHFDSELQSTPTLWDAISDLPVLEAGQGHDVSNYDKPAANSYQESLRIGSSRLYNHVAMHHSSRMVERFSSMSWGDSISDVPDHLKPLTRNGNGKVSHRVYDQNNRRMHAFKPCHTIAASFYANFVHPYSNRNFTPREGARIQSFPDWYVFKGKPTVVSHKLLHREGRFAEKHLCQYNQIGNAVPPLLAYTISKNLLSQIGGT